jgi:hypothetical protein
LNLIREPAFDVRLLNGLSQGIGAFLALVGWHYQRFVDGLRRAKDIKWRDGQRVITEFIESPGIF